MTDAVAPPTAGQDAEDRLTGTVLVFDPAMCCPTGVCGPGADPALLRIVRDLRWLSARGARVERFNLAQAPAAFVEQPTVARLMREQGDGALPAVLVNGEPLAHGRYPSREEIILALTRSDAATAP